MSDRKNFARVSLAVESCGHISQCARDAMETREQRGAERVWLIFNDLPLSITAESTVESVYAEYHQKRRDHHYGEYCKLRQFELILRVTKGEHAWAVRVATAAGLSVSAWARSLLFAGRFRQDDQKSEPRGP